MNFFAYQHLLLVDQSSSGLSFYLAKDVQNLAALDFTNLTLLKKLSNEHICQENLLADEILFAKLLNKNLKSFDLERYGLVFLVAPESSELEKKVMQDLAPFLKQVSFVDRHFFYNFYLMQKRNFSKVKFMINLFRDCAELSCFNQDKLLSYEKVSLRNLFIASQNFWKKTKLKFAFEQPDCFYVFRNNFSEQVEITDLAKQFNLEVIEIDKLC